MSRPASLLKLEQDAYYAVLRALAVNELDWTKEKLLTDLRKVLNITNDQHFKFLEEVMEDKLVLRLQESKNQTAAAAQQQQTPTPAYDMPPPARQQPQAQANSNQRKAGRPVSAAAKNQSSLTSPVGARNPKSSALEPSLSGEQKRNRPKRERDEGFEPRRSSLGQVKSIRTSFGGRSRGRGRRISGIPGTAREVVLAQAPQAVTQAKFKFVPFPAEFFKERLATGSTVELEDMHTALVVKEQSVLRHLDLINQLDDEMLSTQNPYKFGELLIQELELAEENINFELEALLSDDEDAM